jgi:hypothetical protein
LFDIVQPDAFLFVLQSSSELMPAPLSKTLILRNTSFFSLSNLAEIFITPPSRAFEMPCLTAFQPRG